MTEATKLKLCKDCKHCERNDSLTRKHEFSKCSILVRSLDKVSGNKELVYCEHARYNSGKCKESAILFEPKLSLWYKLKNIFRKPL